MNYTDWSIKTYKIGSLYLDPENPRLPRREKRYKQSEIITELVQRGDVYEMAKSISEDGYSPMEMLLIYNETTDGKKYVLEGNRRLTACKLLLNPSLAPKKLQRKYNRLAKSVDPNDISKVKVVIAPNRMAAYPLLVSKHTKSQFKDWKPIMKATFYVKRLEEGLTIEAASDLLGVTESEIKNAVSLLQYYEAAKKLELEDKVREVLEDEYKFEISTFKRLIEKPKVQAFLGAEESDKGDVYIKVATPEFEKGLKKIVSDIALKKENSRSLNSSNDIDDYIENRIESKDRPDLTKKQRKKKVTTIYKGGATKGAAKEKESKPSATTTKPRTPKGLIPAGIRCELDSQRVKDIFIELRKLSPRVYPNACAMDLRMLLELSTYEYLKERISLKEWENQLKAKGERLPKAWVPEMKTMLKKIINDKLVDEAQVIKSLRLFINDNSTNPLLSSLNQFVHNSAWNPNEEKLRNIWKDLEPFLKIVMKKP